MHEMPGRHEDLSAGDDHLHQVRAQVAANEAVRAAEQAVCDAWLADLIEADRLAADRMTGCREATDAARGALGTVLLAGDVRAIARAHATLEGSIRDLEQSIAAYEAVHELLTDQCVWSAEAAALRDDEAATDEHRVAAAMRR